MGNEFSEAVRRESIQRQLTPGVVLHLYCDFLDEPKDKYVVLLCKAPCLLFFINSLIAPFIKREPALARCQVPLEVGDYDFLDHDSWLDCSNVIEGIAFDDIVEQLVAATDRIRGSFNETTRQQIVSVMRSDPTTISSANKTAIDQALS